MDGSVLATKAWYTTIEGLCSHIHDDQFPALLIKAISQVTALDHSIVLAFPNQGRPLHIFNNLPDKRVADNLDSYLDGAYLIDPFYNFCSSNQVSGIYRMRDVVPDDFVNSEYYKTYYVGTGLHEEIGLFIKVDDEFNVALSFGLYKNSSALTEDDVDRLRTIEPMIIALCKQHWHTDRLHSLFNQTEIDHSKAFGKHLNQAFLNFGRDHLSARECEVIRLIIKGHSSKAIARVLDISPDTVKVHRKRLHAKLQIASQAELFSLFLDSIALIPVGSDEDPLTFYFEVNPLTEVY